jgi:hypothetical protein
MDTGLTIRQGDSLLLTATGSGSILTLDADGDGVEDFTGAPGAKFAYQYSATGTFIARAKVDGAEAGSLTIKVVAVDLDGPIACEVGFKREKGVDIVGGTVADVTFTTNDGYLLEVSLKEATTYGARLFLKALKRGTPVLLARLGGATGPLLGMQEVDEFTMETEASEHIVVNGANNTGSSSLIIRPYIPALTAQFNMFASSTTFSGGTTKLTVSTDGVEPSIDPDTGETYAELAFDIEMPLEETRYCFSVFLDQQSRHGTTVSHILSCNGNACRFDIKVVHVYERETQEISLDIIPLWFNVAYHNYDHYHEIKPVEGNKFNITKNSRYSCISCQGETRSMSWQPKFKLNLRAPLKTRFFCDFLGDSGVYKEEVFDKRKKNKELVQKI